MHDVVLGVDSSTQSTKVIALDLETGSVHAEGKAAHRGLDVQNPEDWWQALVLACRQAVRPEMRVRGISIAAQQHGLVTLARDGSLVRDASLWNNTEAAEDAERLNAMADFAAETGTRLVSSITIAKLAHLARTAPDDLDRTESIGLPHDWLNFRLTGALVTDRGEASGSGWWSPVSESTRRDLLQLAVGEGAAQRLRLPEVLGPNDPAGELTLEAAKALGIPAGIPVGPGTGDNMAAALGLGAKPGAFVVSLGTSGTAYSVSEQPTADPSGEVCGFADATGRYLPLTCMLNCTRVVDSIARLAGLSTMAVLDEAENVDPGAGGLLLMPYLTGERTPNMPNATGTLLGVSMQNLNVPELARAAVDGVAAGLTYCLGALRRAGMSAPEIVLVGGGSRHRVWQQAIADATGLPVRVLVGGEHVARGAAIQAAAIVRSESVARLADAWRPNVVDTAEPRGWALAGFRLEERAALIDAARV